MSGKKKKPASAPLPASALKERIARAREEGRTMQALDLAKQLAKSEPTAPNKTLLQACYLERARQLRSAGQTRDAAGVADLAAGLAHDPASLEAATVELLKCGNADRAGFYLTRLPE